MYIYIYIYIYVKINWASGGLLSEPERARKHQDLTNTLSGNPLLGLDLGYFKSSPYCFNIEPYFKRNRVLIEIDT